ncbi:putative oxidoreductase [Octadecabacter antarcticus 307]|uniref:Putative oxidoreductase n=1 Tax=Octadecabacter antarcticus 307 TaxID=391626 RepID=M9RD72_9RHOB|nr:Gfo/Idh/MocA family oxidoreductase [Octadecabacter antarcticus]AGI69708.1 putative oxidoreductase [Octadecabacter antarcticus 307]
MKVVTAGIGLRAAHVLSIFKETMPEMEIVGFYDPQPTHLHLIGDDVPQFGDVAQMLEHTQPDLFFVASPNCFHFEHIKLGLAAGVRMFSEKPVVTTKADTIELAGLLAEHGTDQVIVGLVLRHSQHMIDLRAVLDDLGPITSLEASEHIAPYHGAFFMRDWRRMVAWSGGFMLEKCCHDLDIYNMVTRSRPKRVASFGGRKSFTAEFTPTSNTENEIMHRKASVWESCDDAFLSDGDIIDYQTAIIQYESGASLSFHTNLNVPDEHRRFCMMGALGMAEGDFSRGFLNVTARDGHTIAEHDYTKGDPAKNSAHYGADHMMVADIVAFLRGETSGLPVGVVDALEAGLAAMAVDEARISGTIVDMTVTWAQFDGFGLRA